MRAEPRHSSTNESGPDCNITRHFPEDEPRRPGQRLPTAMLGNEVMTKEQLYDLFQQILNVKKFEHQLLYNAMQVILVSVANSRKKNICDLFSVGFYR